LKIAIRRGPLMALIAVTRLCDSATGIGAGVGARSLVLVLVLVLAVALVFVLANALVLAFADAAAPCEGEGEGEGEGVELGVAIAAVVVGTAAAVGAATATAGLTGRVTAMLLGRGAGADRGAAGPKTATGEGATGAGAIALPRRSPPASASNCERQPSEQAYRASPLILTTCETSSTMNRLLQQSQTTPLVVSPRRLLP
jgi:hypothetical protein